LRERRACLASAPYRDREDQAAWRAPHRAVSSVPLGDRIDDRESEPDAARRARPRGGGPAEAVEDPLQRLFRDPATVVLDLAVLGAPGTAISTCPVAIATGVRSSCEASWMKLLTLERRTPILRLGVPVTAITHPSTTSVAGSGHRRNP